MAGLPFSGKTYVLGLIAEALLDKECLVISPKVFREDGYEQLNEEAKREMNLAAWEASLEFLGKAIQEDKNKDIIFYDTACSSLRRMEIYFQAAKRHGHKILYLYVHADVDKCKERGASIDDAVFDKYNSHFTESVEPLIKMSDAHVYIENNDDSTPDVGKAIGLMRKLGN